MLADAKSRFTDMVNGTFPDHGLRGFAALRRRTTRARPTPSEMTSQDGGRSIPGRPSSYASSSSRSRSSVASAHARGNRGARARRRTARLLFDLVFVFAFTQVTTLLAGNPTWSGLGHALLVLTALWWAWASYAWLTNTADAEAGPVWGAMPRRDGRAVRRRARRSRDLGAHGVVFGVAFLIVNGMHTALYALAARGNSDLMSAALRAGRWSLAGSVLILVAGFADGGPTSSGWPRSSSASSARCSRASAAGASSRCTSPSDTG